MEQSTNRDLLEIQLQVRHQARIDAVAEARELIAEGEKQIEGFDLVIEALDSEGDAALVKQLQVARQEVFDVVVEAHSGIANLQEELIGFELLRDRPDVRAKWFKLRDRMARQVRREDRENRGESDSPQERPTQRPRRRRTPRKGTLQDRVQTAAYKILKEEGRPLKRKELTDRVIESGVTMNAEKPPKQLGKILKLDSRFHNIGGGLWFLAELVPQPQNLEQVAEDVSRRSTTEQTTYFQSDKDQQLA